MRFFFTLLLPACLFGCGQEEGSPATPQSNAGINILLLTVDTLRPDHLIPLVQRLGLSLPYLLSGTLVIEVIFSWPGVGFAVFQAMLQRDYPVILAATAMTGALVAGGNLLADLLHAWLDPRVRDAA